MTSVEILGIILGGVWSLLIFFLTYIVNKLGKTIEELSIEVQKLSRHEAEQNVINNSTRKLAEIVEKVEWRVTEHDIQLAKIKSEMKISDH